MSLDVDKVRRSARRVAKFVKRSPKSPSSDAVHKLRTRIRQLESSLVALELDSKPTVSLLKSLKKTRRLAGRVRDMDVLTAKALTVEDRLEQDCLVQLLQHLGATRSKNVRRLRRDIEGKRRKLLKGLDRMERLAGRSRKDDDASAAPGVATRAIQLSSALSRPGRLSNENLHEYRSRVKELRDVLRLSDKAADSALVERLAAVKDAIGDWHDWVELTDIATGLLDHGSSCELIRRLETTRDSRYRHALTLTRALVARHLRANPRKRRKRPSANAPLATPVLEAVAQITQETRTGRVRRA